MGIRAAQEQPATEERPGRQRFFSTLEHAGSYTVFRGARLQEFLEVFFRTLGREEIGFFAQRPAGGGHLADTGELGCRIEGRVGQGRAVDDEEEQIVVRAAVETDQGHVLAVPDDQGAAFAGQF